MSIQVPWGHINVLVVWIIIFSIAYLYFDQHQNPKVAVIKGESQHGEVFIPRSIDGHYYVRGSINGHPIDFMVDTGASIVSVSKTFAQIANLPTGAPANFSTAGGTVIGEIVPGQFVEAGGIAVNNLNISVGIHGGTALLGQNFLRHVDVVQSNDTMILRVRSE